MNHWGQSLMILFFNHKYIGEILMNNLKRAISHIGDVRSLLLVIDCFILQSKKTGLS